MGLLVYDDERFEFDDRVLAHLQVVITAKLRRGEPFFLTWGVDREQGAGRHSIWIDNGVPLHMKYSGGRPPHTNRDWVERLISSANSTFGLVVTPEAFDHEEVPEH